MKPKDEIKKLANEWSLINSGDTMENNSSLNKGYIAGYTKCQEDMVNNFLSLIEEFKEKELPNRNVPYHYESEIASGLKYFEIFIKEKQTRLT
jgi:hypothetical protein